MADDLGTYLAHQSGDIERPREYHDIGQVTQVSPLLVAIGAGSGQPVTNVVAGYLPVVGDMVLVLVIGATRIVIADLSGPDSGTYTPALTDMSVGTTGSTNTAEYTYSNGILVVDGYFIWGTAGSRTFPITTTTWTFPPGFTADTLINSDHEVGTCTMRTTVVARGFLWLTTAGLLRPIVGRADANNNVVPTSPTSTIPGTWADGHRMTWHAVVRGSF